MKKIILITAITFALVGCASVKMGDAGKDTAYKAFKAPADKAALYIYRNESMGAVSKMDVEIDGKAIGQTASKTYLYKEVAPGKHVITSKAENTDTLEVDTKPGFAYYIWQEVKMGFFGARNKLQLVDEAKGQKGVRETKLADTQ
jgi:uncharacterized protein YceK